MVNSQADSGPTEETNRGVLSTNTCDQKLYKVESGFLDKQVTHRKALQRRKLWPREKKKKKTPQSWGRIVWFARWPARKATKLGGYFPKLHFLPDSPGTLH